MSGKPAARLGDKVSGGVIVSGSTGVLIGDSGAMACSVCPGGVKGVGSPVNPQLGAKVLLGAADLDFALPGALPLVWQRQYSSYVNAEHGSQCGMLGHGWKSAQQIGIGLSEEACLLFDAAGRVITFEPLAPGQSQYSASEDLHLMRGGADAPWARQRRWAHLHAALTLSPELVLAASGDSDLAWVFAPAPAEPVAPTVGLRLFAQLDRFGRSQRYEYSQGHEPSASPNEEPGSASLPAGLLIGITDGVGRSYRLIHQRIHAGHPAQGLLHADSGWRLAGVELTHDPVGIGPLPLALVRYGYSAAGELTQVYDRSGTLTREFEYEHHRISAHRHQGGPWHRYRYESAAPGARVIEHSNQAGLSYRFEYLDKPPSPEGIPRAATRTTDSLGRVEHYHFEGAAGLERLICHERADGSALHYSYDGAGRLASSTDPLGRVTRIARDGQGRISGVQLPGGIRSSQQWDEASGQLLQSQDGTGAVTRYAWDEHQRLVQITQADGSQEHYRYPDPRQSPLTCDSPHEIQDARGGIKRLTFSEAGLLVSYSDCSQSTTAYRHDRFGELIEVQDALGGRTVHERDAQGRIIATGLPSGQVERYAYNAQGQLSRIEPQGQAEHAITLAYDLWGRLTQRSHGGLSVAFEYDVAGRLTHLINENGAISRFAWDAMDRLTQEEGFDQRLQRYQWDAAGQLTQASDGSAERQSATHYRWNEAGRLAQRHLPATQAAPAQVHCYAWDPAGRLMAASVSLIQGQQQTLQSRIEIERDSLARVTAETQRLYTQDAQGKEQIEFEHRIAHRLDALGNRQASELQGLGAIDWLSYGSGHVHGLTHNQTALIDFERDALHRETRRRLHGAAPLHIRRQWDSLGRLQALASEGLHASAHTLQGAPSVPQVLIGQLAQRRYHYDALGQLAAIQMPSQLLRYGYDGAGRLRAAADSLAPQAQQRWNIDPAGNRLPGPGTGGEQGQGNWAARVHAHWRQEHFDLLNPGPQTHQGNGPITRWSDNRIGYSDQAAWRYDAYGNRVEQLQGDGSGQSLAYDGAHQLIEVRVQPPAIGGSGHDSNTITGTRATTASTSRYTYDALGRRLKRSVSTEASASAQERTHYHGWDGDRLIHTEALVPQDRQGQPQRRITHTVYEPGSFTPLVRLSTTGGPQEKPHALVAAIAATLEEPDPDSQQALAMMSAMLRAMPQELQQQSDQAMRQALQQGLPKNGLELLGSQAHDTAKTLTDMHEQLQRHEQKGKAPIQIHFYHCDHLGTPLALTDQEGKIAWAARLDPWGSIQEEYNPSGIEQDIRLPGQHQDRETGLYYNRHRYYDPSLGGYVQLDPIGLAGGINTYAYVEGNPVSNIDPLGLETYICRRPLGGAPGSYAPPLLNHTYVCVGSGASMVCGSTTASSGGALSNILKGSPGTPTTSATDYFKPEACERRWGEDSCIETCVANALNNLSRPKYGVGLAGTDCQEYTEDVVRTCEKRCGRM